MRSALLLLVLATFLTACEALQQMLPSNHTIASTVQLGAGGSAEGKIVSTGSERLSVRLTNRGPGVVVCVAGDDKGRTMQEIRLSRESRVLEFRPVESFVTLTLRAEEAATNVEYETSCASPIRVEWNLTHAFPTGR